MDGPGGMGKTFLYKLLLAHLRAQGKVALAVASSGIAALLIEGGRTAHSRFKIPVPAHETSTCRCPPRLCNLYMQHPSLYNLFFTCLSFPRIIHCMQLAGCAVCEGVTENLHLCRIRAQSDLAELIRQAELIVWDKAPMMPRYVYEAVSSTLQGITGVGAPFGGKLFLLGGDFRQVLPVIPRADPAEVVASCINTASFWPRVTVLRLWQNMRVSRLEGEGLDAAPLRSWAEFLERIGNGTEPVVAMGGAEDYVRLPDTICLPPEARNEAGLIDSIFGECQWNDRDWITGRAILAARNEEVNRMNDKVFDRFPADGAPMELFSADSTEGEGDQEASYPVEFLNSLTPSGMPPHRLHLRKGMPIMLMRNLNSAKGLAGGTRLIVKGMQRHVINAEIATGSHVGKRVFIPCITLTPTEDGFQMPFKLERRQFPVRLAFAMTINKAQGQTLGRMGLFLPTPVFSYGQLYVALLRVVSAHLATVLAPGDMHDPAVFTRNVVFKEVFR